MEGKIIERIKYLLMSAEVLSIDVKKETDDLEDLFQKIKKGENIEEVHEQIKKSRSIGTFLALKSNQLDSTNKIISELYSLLRINTEPSYYEDQFSLEEFQILKELEKHHSSMYVIQGGEARLRSAEFEELITRELSKLTMDKLEEFYTNIKNRK